MRSPLCSSWASRPALLGAAALAAAAILPAAAHAATLYIADEGDGQIYQFPSAAIANGTSTATASNTFAALADAAGVTVDPATGNVIANNFNGGSSVVNAYGPSGGSNIGTAGADGGASWNTVLYNGYVYTSQYTPATSGKGIVDATYASSGGTATFGTYTTLTTGTGTQHVVAMALVPSNSTGNSTSNTYLFYESGTTGVNPTFNALNLSNGNTMALSSSFTNSINTFLAYGMAYDPNNGLIYGAANVGSGYLLFSLTPSYSNGTLASMSYTSLTTTGSVSLDNPVGVAFGPDNNLYVAEANDDEIDEINVDGYGTGTQGHLSKFIGLSAAPWGVAFTPTSTPEPATLGILAFTGLGLLARRRRTCKST